MVQAYRAGAGQFHDIDFDALTEAAETRRAIAAPLGRRARKRTLKKRASEAGMLSALLGVQGCLSIFNNEALDMTAPSAGESAQGNGNGKPGGGGAGAGPVDTVVFENATAELSVASLLESEQGAVAFDRIVKVENGEAHFDGTVIHFTPTPGFEGLARITFKYFDVDGKPHVAHYDILVDDDAAAVLIDPPGGGDDGHDHGGGGDDGSGGGDGGSGGDDGHDHGGGDDGSGGGDDSGSGGGHDHGGGSGTPHADDPSKMAEHVAAMNLVPVADATHVAVNSGSWFDPATWANGEVPGDGAKVVIPEGVDVLYDGVSEASLFTVRIDGCLDFATDRDTLMEVDTMVVTGTGCLCIGEDGNPVDAGVEAVIRIAANGPIDTAWDPLLLSRGIISHGETHIHGAEKENFIKVAVDPIKGDTSMQLSEIPEGWQVGDRIVLTGTHLTETGSYANGEARTGDVTEDEVLTITSISGKTVTFDKPLQYDHDGENANLKAYVANYTRNVRIETEGGAATPVHERGHVMFMHSDNVDVRYAQFEELGRTDKSERAVDAQEASDAGDIASDTNVKARYPFHLHRTGVDHMDEPAMVVGNVVWGSPGWGYVHHDSNALMVGNNSYNVLGAAFVAETGNETGRWADNISIKTLGVNVAAKEPGDIDAFDLGRVGAGFYFQGRLVDAVDNVAAGSPGGWGFLYMSRMPLEDMIAIDPEGVLQGEKLRYADGVFANVPNIGLFSGNEAIAVRNGLEVIKEGPRQEHDVRTVIDDFTAWQVYTGIHLQYTGHYTIRGAEIHGTYDGSPLSEMHVGILYGTNAFDMVVVDSLVEGFTRGITVRHESLFDGITDFRYAFIDVDLQNNWRDYQDWAIGGSGVAADRFLTAADLPNLGLDYISAFGDGFAVGPNNPGDAPLILAGTKRDTLGVTDTSSDWDPFKITFDQLKGAVEQNGYWTTAGGQKITLVEEYVADRVTGEIAKFAVFVTVPTGLNLDPNGAGNAVRVAPEYHGTYDPSNAGPNAVDDAATVQSGKSVIIDVLANDSDPDGDVIDLDGLVAGYGHIVDNGDGTVTYFADEGFTGVDTFWYWAADDQGNFTKAEVTVTVEI